MKNAKVTAKEIELALRLVEDMEEKWQPEKQGRGEAGAEVIDLMALLKKSVERKPPHAKPKRAARSANKARRRHAA